MKTRKSPENRGKIIIVSVVTMIINVILTVVKFYFGSHGHSSALMADGLHTAVDAVTTAVVIYAVASSGKVLRDKAADLAGYTVGIATIFLAVYVIIAKFSGLVQTSFKADYKPSKLTAIVAAASIVIKAVMAFVTFRLAKKYGSFNLRLDGKHHLMDAVSSCVSLAGIVVSGMAWKIGDSIACVVVAVLILKTAFDILIPAVKSMINITEVPEMENRVRSLLCMQEAVKKAENVDVDLVGDAYFVKADVYADAGLTLAEADKLTKKLEDTVEFEFTELRDCRLRVHPFSEKEVEACQK